jgi:hypothetical protein
MNNEIINVVIYFSLVIYDTPSFFKKTLKYIKNLPKTKMTDANRIYVFNKYININTRNTDDKIVSSFQDINGNILENPETTTYMSTYDRYKMICKERKIDK